MTRIILAVVAAVAMGVQPATSAAQNSNWTGIDPSAASPEIGSQLAPTRPQLSDAQRQGMRWGARIGFLAGLVTGAVLLTQHECVGMDCMVSPGMAAVGYLGLLPAAATVVGAGAGLVVGTITDDDRRQRAYVGFRLGGAGPR